MIYFARIHDDGRRIDILPKCMDRHGDCSRWKSEGFCDRNSNTFYTRQNPGHYQYTLDNCFVSCNVGCGAEAANG